MPTSRTLKRKLLEIIENQKVEKKSRKSKGDKYKSMDPSNQRRRRERAWKRVSRGHTKRENSAAQPVPKDSTCSRHVPCYICGRRRTRCNCFENGVGKVVAQCFNRKMFHPLPQRILKSDIQTWRDTGDMTCYHRQISSKKRIRFDVLWPLTFCWRIFSNGYLWNALQEADAVSLTNKPVWSRWRLVMETFRHENVSWYAGLFYSGNKLLKYRYSKEESWRCCTALKMDDIERLLEAMKIVWHVADLLKKDLLELQKKPTRELWRQCTQHFLGEIRSRTVGMFADYSLKKTLDGILIMEPGLEGYISYWPMLCPAYVQKLSQLYPGIQRKQETLFLAACHYHVKLKAFCPKMRFGESLAQLCWIKRKVTN